MAKYDATELDIEQLMLRIKESAAKRKLATRHSSSQSGAWAYPPLRDRSQSYFEADLPDLKLTPEFKTHKDNHYHVNDLLKLHDRHFVRSAYRAILKREPDDEGFRGYLERLRSGRRNKIDILASLRFSAEGRQRKVRVDGLIFPAMVRAIGQVPIIGYVFQLLIGILRLPPSISERRRFESYSLIQQQELIDYVNRMTGIIRKLCHFVNELPAGIDQQRELTTLLEQEQRELTALLEQQQLGLTALLKQQEQKLGLQENALLVHENALAELSEAATAQRTLSEGLHAQLTDNKKNLRAHSEEMERLSLAMQHVRTDLTMQQARAASLIKAIDKSLGVTATPKQFDIIREEDSHMLDALYVSLENHFRGDSSELKERFEIYLPYLEQAGITTDILDVGCGPGEWLELLGEKGFRARGVDANRLMAEQCQASGLKVICGNAIDYLRSLPDNSVSAVTSFHVIEHLEFTALVELIDEIVRTLRSGGLLILETPNPENMIVASCNFYLDPSHRRPLPSEMMRFLLEARGLTNIEVVGLHPLASCRVDGDTELANRFNDLFYGPMDYAIIAQRI